MEEEARVRREVEEENRRKLMALKQQEEETKMLLEARLAMEAKARAEAEQR